MLWAAAIFLATLFVASKIGIPVSTTHVSCGSLFGIELVNRQAKWNVIAGIISAWLLTLPLAALVSAGFFWILGRIFS